MWLMSGRASGHKNSAPVIFINTAYCGIFGGLEDFMSFVLYGEFCVGWCVVW